MPFNFLALQFVGEVALGLLGFSAILIGLARVDDGGFEPPDSFRVKLLLFTGAGALFGAILPFVFAIPGHPEQIREPLLYLLFVYICLGPLYFIPQVRGLRAAGHTQIFSLPILAFNVTIFSSNVITSAIMVFYADEMRAQLYLSCLTLLLIQCMAAFIRTLFYRVQR